MGALINDLDVDGVANAFLSDDLPVTEELVDTATWAVDNFATDAPADLRRLSVVMLVGRAKARMMLPTWSDLREHAPLAYEAAREVLSSPELMKASGLRMLSEPIGGLVQNLTEWVPPPDGYLAMLRAEEAGKARRARLQAAAGATIQ